MILILCSITMLVPFLWMISSSLKNMDELFAIPSVDSQACWAGENYVYV